jgi:hypothetical protein
MLAAIGPVSMPRAAVCIVCFVCSAATPQARYLCKVVGCVCTLNCIKTWSVIPGLRARAWRGALFQKRVHASECAADLRAAAGARKHAVAPQVEPAG